MKKIYLIISSISLALLFSACGGGSGDTTDINYADNNSSEISPSNIEVVNCDTNTTTDIYSGDTLVKDSDDTVVTLIENADGTKNVCVENGSAHIIR